MTRGDQEKPWLTGRRPSRTRVGPTRRRRCQDWCQPLKHYPNFRFRQWTEKYRFPKAAPTPCAVSALPAATNFWGSLTRGGRAETEVAHTSPPRGNTFLTRDVRVFVNKLFRFSGELLRDEWRWSRSQLIPCSGLKRPEKLAGSTEKHGIVKTFSPET